MRELISFPKLGDFTQGAILNCLKVAEHKRSFGLIISARCDIAHRKSKTVLCLPVYTLSEWLEEVAKPEIIAQSRKSVEKTYSDVLVKYNIPISSFRIYGFDATVAALKKNGASLGELEKINTAQPYIEHGQIVTKIKAVKESYNKVLESLWRNARMDCHFLERIQVDENRLGYVIDFTQPMTLSRTLLDELSLGIEKFKIDKDANGKYGSIYLDELDQGEIISILKSPFIEHILQRFTHYYSRIGTSDITSNDLLSLKGTYEII